MPVTRVERTVAAPRQAVWDVLADPYHQARWWPLVQRVDVSGDGRWTQLLRTERGKGVRADFRLLASEPPRLIRWEQELEGSPFAGILARAETTIELVPAADDEAATCVRIELRQQLRGWSRLAPFLFRRAARRQLGEALAGLDAIVAG
jgi:uncharacterized protein YndB with AHSA1/START domain